MLEVERLNAPMRFTATQAGATAGDVLAITVEVDRSERTVAVPDDLAALLKKNPTAQATFASLSFSHKREYVEWIESANKAETRSTRLGKTIDLLNEGRKSRT